MNYSGTQAQWDAIHISNGNDFLTLAAVGSVSGTCGENLTWLFANGTMTISGTGDMPDNFREGNGFLPITRVVIEPGITSIGSYAFSFCCDLTSVIIPEGVTSIGDSAFGQCYSLTSVTIPASVTSIGNNAFVECNSLTTVNYGGTQAQWDAISIARSNEQLNNFRPGAANSGSCGENLTWTLANGTLTISGTGAMADYHPYTPNTPWYSVRNAITSVVIQSGVTSIGSHAFSLCLSLISVTIPDTVTSIGSAAFTSCGSLRSVTITEGVTAIESYVFSGCCRLTSVTIPEGVTTIGSSAFSGCSLQSVTIPSSVTTIGENAFQGCELTSLNYGGTQEQWNAISVAGGNEALNVVRRDDHIGTCGPNLTWTLANGTLTISGTGDMTNYGRWNSEFAPWYSICSLITGVIIQSGVTSIGSNAFYSCHNLNSVTIPESVTAIGDLAFYGCSSLTAVNYNGTQEQWDAIRGLVGNGDGNSGNDLLVYITEGAVSGYYVGVSWSLAEGILTVGGSYITSGAMPDFWRQVDSFATSLVIQPGMISIGERTFSGCSRVTSITIPSSVTSICNAAFSGCDSLTTVYYDGTREQWDAIVIAAQNGPLVTAEIVCTGTAEAPADYRVVLPRALTTVENEAFMGNTAMTAVEIPGGITMIGYRAFKDCSGLTTVIFDGSAPIIAPDAFAGVTATVRYPANDASWTASAMQSYGGNLTWEAYTG